MEGDNSSGEKMKILLDKLVFLKRFRQITAFVVSGLVFILLTKASMNIQSFISNIFYIVSVELIFLLLAYLSLRVIFERIKSQSLSYVAYFIVFGLFGLFVFEYILNNNKDLAFFAFGFLFILKGLEATVARVFVDIELNKTSRESFLRKTLFFYSFYILVSLLGVFAFASKSIWNFGFVVFLLAMFTAYLHFLFRLIKPKEEKREVGSYKDVSFY